MNSVLETTGYDSHIKNIEGAISGVSSALFSPWSDSWKRIKVPNAWRLIQEFKRTAYACGNINASAISCLNIKLLVTTKKNQPKTRWPTKALDRDSRLITSKDFSKQLKRLEVTEEVLDHPVLDLLEEPNPHMDKARLFELTQLYQEFTGRAYWFSNFNALDLPEDIWIVPTQNLEPKRNPGSKKVVDFYDFINGENSDKFSPEEITSFLMPDLKNPYLAGTAPLEAAFENYEIESRQIAHEASMLYNEARPDAAFIPDKDASFDDDDAAAEELKIEKKFARGGQGRWIFMTESGKVVPLQWPPRDIGKLEISKRAKITICNAFSTPIPLLESEKVTTTQLEASMIQLARLAVKPRGKRIVGVLNKELIPHYDTSRRLFFGFEDPTPEDRAQKLQEVVQLVMNGIMTPNEGREEFDLQPVDGGDELRPINVSPDIMRQQERESGSAER